MALLLIIWGMEWSLSTHHTAPTIKVGRSVRQDDGAGGAYTALIRREGIVHRSILFLICCLLLKHLAAGNICYLPLDAVQRYEKASTQHYDIFVFAYIMPHTLN